MGVSGLHPEPLVVEEDRGRLIEGENQPQLEVGVFQEGRRDANRRVTRTRALGISWGSHRFSPLLMVIIPRAGEKGKGAAPENRDFTGQPDRQGPARLQGDSRYGRPWRWRRSPFSSGGVPVSPPPSASFQFPAAAWHRCFCLAPCILPLLARHLSLTFLAGQALPDRYLPNRQACKPGR